MRFIGVLSFCALFMIRPCIAFIPNALLGTSSPTSIFHSRMTEEALLEAAKEYFNDHLPQGMQNITGIDPAAIFEQFYGIGADPEGFEDVMGQMMEATSSVDGGETVTMPKWHFCSETFEAAQQNLVDNLNKAVDLINDGDYHNAREILGKISHPVQDFYSHSNWIEMGKTTINYNLAIEGKDMGVPIAAPDQPTCSDCSRSLRGQTTSAILGLSIVGLGVKVYGGDTGNIYDCKENLIAKDVLTSGFYEGQGMTYDDGTEVIKPPGKCSHGGILDASSGKNATGGINKDANNPLFASHYYLHETAAPFAINATIYLYQTARKKVGDDKKWAQFLQLTPGGSLTLVVDVSDSMKSYITPLKQSFTDVLSKTNSSVNKITEIIVIPFTGSMVGPPYRAGVEDIFRNKLSSDFVSAGSGRRTFEALGLGGDLSFIDGAVFLVTNGVPTDLRLFSYVKDIFSTKRLKLYCAILADGDVNFATVQKDVYGQYSSLTVATGGNVVLMDEKDIRNINFEDEFSSSKALLFTIAQETKRRSVDFPVDSSISKLEFEVTSSGNVPRLLVKEPTGTNHDFQNIRAGNRYFVASVDYPQVGLWTVIVEPEEGTQEYILTVRARSNLRFTYRALSTEENTGHPGLLTSVNQRPRAGETVHVHIGTVRKMDVKLIWTQFYDLKGSRIAQYPLEKAQEDSFHRSHFHAEVIVPDQPFFVATFGYNADGEPVFRTKPAMLEPSTLFINGTMPRRIKGSKTDHRVNFRMINHGPTELFSIQAFLSRSKIEVKSVEPSGAIVARGDTIMGHVILEVPVADKTSSATLYISGKTSRTANSNTYHQAIAI